MNEERIYRDTDGVCVKALCSKHRPVFNIIILSQKIQKRRRDRLNRNAASNVPELKHINAMIRRRKSLLLNLRCNRHLPPDCDMCRFSKFVHLLNIVDYNAYCLPSAMIEHHARNVAVVGSSPAGGSASPVKAKL